jgi:hypothetical protein
MLDVNNYLSKCPLHDLPKWYVFYGGLREANKIEIDMAC